MTRLFVPFLAAVVVAAAVPLAAEGQADEQRATVVLRSGERVAGTFEDVQNDTLFVRVSLHDQRKIPMDQVLLIDFAGGASGLPQSETSATRAGEHLLLMQGGQSVRGRLVDVRGGAGSEDPNSPRTLYFTENGQERRIEASRVSRIYLGQYSPVAAANDETSPTGATSATGNTAANVPAGAIRVAGNTPWTPTSLRVQKGDRVTFSTTGQVTLSTDGSDVASPAGSLKQRFATGAPLPTNYAGALIARVGNSQPFPIGDTSTPVTMPADGMLFLGINDDQHADNQGEFIVSVTRARR